MAKRIEITKRFERSVNSLRLYLEQEWSKKVANNFIKELKSRIEYISKYPEIGMLSQKQNVRSVTVGRHNRMYYLFNDEQITLLLLRDMRMNPKSNPFEK